MTLDSSNPTEQPAFSEWLEETDERFADAERRRVEVFVRSMLPPLGAKSRQERLIERLDELTAAGEIDEVSVTVTGNRLCLCETCQGTDAEEAILDRIRELDDWGREHGASVSPFFETRELDSQVAEETARALVPPRVAVALYCDGTLSGVFPCRMGEATYATADFVAALDRFCESQQAAVEL